MIVPEAEIARGSHGGVVLTMIVDLSPMEGAYVQGVESDGLGGAGFVARIEV
jgi:hypothetical protein